MSGFALSNLKLWPQCEDTDVQPEEVNVTFPEAKI